MDMDMMMQYHQELYRLHSCLSSQHCQISQTQMQIANLNQQIYMHMRNGMDNGNNNHSNMSYLR